MDFDEIGAAIWTEAEVHGAIARRGVADAGGHVVVLRSALRYEFDARADAVTVALGSAESYVKPMAGVLAAVHPDFSIFSQCSDDHIDAAVSVEVAEGASAVARGGCGVESGFLR